MRKTLPSSIYFVHWSIFCAEFYQRIFFQVQFRPQTFFGLLLDFPLHHSIDFRNSKRLISKIAHTTSRFFCYYLYWRQKSFIEKKKYQLLRLPSLKEPLFICRSCKLYISCSFFKKSVSYKRFLCTRVWPLIRLGQSENTPGYGTQ